MQISTELTEALAANPLLTQTVTPPDDVPLHIFYRTAGQAVVAPLIKYYGERLPPSDQYIVSDKQVPVDGGEMLVRVFAPSGSKNGQTFPVEVWYHGGGWQLGDIIMDDNHLTTICVDLQIVIVNVEYRLAPEHPFPAPFEDSYTAAKWAAENAASLGADIKKGFLVGGDSAGGNIASAVALKARDDPFFESRPLTGQYLREPATVHPTQWPEKLKTSPSSLELCVDTPLLNSGHVLASLNVYGGPPADTRVSPLLATSHAGLPPAYMQVMGADPLRDDGLAYERVLREAGVKTKLDRYEGALHGAHYTFPAHQASLKMDRDEREGVKWLLSLNA